MTRLQVKTLLGLTAALYRQQARVIVVVDTSLDEEIERYIMTEYPSTKSSHNGTSRQLHGVPYQVRPDSDGAVHTFEVRDPDGRVLMQGHFPELAEPTDAFRGVL